VNFGIALGALNPHFHLDATMAAEDLGYESVWLPEHLVFTRAMTRSPHPGETHPPVPPDAPIFDAFAYLGFLAGRTERVRLGTHVYNIGLRHPFTTARGAQTVDLLSNGRFEFGIGASWLEEEWVATQLDFTTRGRRVDEVVEIYKQLCTEETISHHGEFFSFDEVVFEPKPVQKPWPPIIVGGGFPKAAQRAIAYGDGWIPIAGPDLVDQIGKFRQMAKEAGRDPNSLSVSAFAVQQDVKALRRFRDLRVERAIFLVPSAKSDTVLPMLDRWAELMRQVGG
jgi:probable F420-dependent oxidoreductase